MGTARVGVLDVRSEGENGREFTSEATGIHCKEREGRKSVFMEECGCSQCGRWNGEITLPGVGEGYEDDLSRHLTSSPCTHSQAERKFLFTVINAALGNGAE